MGARMRPLRWEEVWEFMVAAGACHGASGYIASESKYYSPKQFWESNRIGLNYREWVLCQLPYGTPLHRVQEVSVRRIGAEAREYIKENVKWSHLVAAIRTYNRKSKP